MGGEMYTMTLAWKVPFIIALLVLAARSTPLAAQEAKHPNLLLNQNEIDQVKLKIIEQPWAARLLERTKTKAEKEESALDAALAYVLTGETKYADMARRRLLREAR